ncbi:ubiquitin family protein [Mycena albidolilacea]|uniref:Ubiquitin family protein n=1 Tax=Mycena albidolilacea TaxID=1033008 RepID=A0AAD7ETI7_9AGAR|nr:ubiquitin family protein [Mycena albidolilacea]
MRYRLQYGRFNLLAYRSADSCPESFIYPTSYFYYLNEPAETDENTKQCRRIPTAPLQSPRRPQRRRGKKPLIYLFSPHIIEATVKLSLVHTWTFSSVYPIFPVKMLPSGRQVVQILVELGTGLEVSSLFWEANVVPEREVQHSQPDQPESSIPADDSQWFNPASCSLSDENAVLLSTSNAASYLNSVLELLGLHTEARTSFVTFWLPSFFLHKHIALRFLPQSMHSHAAPLSMDPQPDVVTRIFMLFTGVADEDHVVSIEEDQILDERLFRVLEWGGMEI